MPIFRKIDHNLSLEELQSILRSAELNLVDDNGQSGPAELVGITEGTVAGIDTDVATFERADAALPPVVLLSDIPASEEDKEVFFQKLPKQGLELICFADVLVESKPREVVACRMLQAAAGATQEEQAVAAAQAVNNAQPAPASNTSGSDVVSSRAFDLIREFEGLDQPSKWPGGASGITIGVGYDLGYNTTQEFERDWSQHLDQSALDLLKTAIGKTGGAAKAIAPQFRGIHIAPDQAKAVFTTRTLPRFSALAQKAFPGMEDLPKDAQGALVSLVFNRGTAMDGDRRREMRAIRDILASNDVKAHQKQVCTAIAQQIRSMKRLWEGQGLDGLLRRRDAEADLVQASVQSA